MTSAARKPSPRPRRKSPAEIRVVQQPPMRADVDEFPGQGQRLFQLFREPLMRHFALAPKDSTHG